MGMKAIYMLLSTVILYISAMIFGYLALWLFAIFVSLILLCAIIMIVSGVWLVKFEQRASNSIIEKGSETNIVLKCMNKSLFIFPEVVVCHHDGKQEKITVFPGIHEHFTVFRPMLKGGYNIGVDKIYLKDFFGLFTYSVKMEAKEKIFVLPCVRDYKITNTSEANDYIKKSKMDKCEDKNVISDLREYKYGDTINRINWKATAKFNDVIVNNYDDRFCSKTLIYVGGLLGNEHPENLMYDDFACEIATTFAANIVREKNQLSIVYEGRENIVDSDLIKSFEEYRMYLAESTVGEMDCCDQTIALIQNMTLNKIGYSKVLFVMRNISSKVISFAKSLQANNVAVDVYKMHRLDENRLTVSKLENFDKGEIGHV